MTITSVRLMFATDNRATPFALRGYFNEYIHKQKPTFPWCFPTPEKSHGLYEKIQGIYFKICALYFKTNGLYFSSFLIS